MLSVYRALPACLPTRIPLLTRPASYLQERVLATLEAAVSEASVATASTSAAAEALSRKVLHELALT